MDEPSNGVDIGARNEIFRIIQERASRGMTVIMSSSQYDDIAAICSRVLIFSRGRVAAELVGADVIPDRLLGECYRAESAPAGAVS